MEQYYTHLYTYHFLSWSELEEVDFERISVDQCWWLERPFTLEEVEMVLNSMEEDKAQGPDGFPTKFIQACWDVVGSNVMAVFSDFHSKNQW